MLNYLFRLCYAFVWNVFVEPKQTYQIILRLKSKSFNFSFLFIGLFY